MIAQAEWLRPRRRPSGGLSTARGVGLSELLDAKEHGGAEDEEDEIEATLRHEGLGHNLIALVLKIAVEAGQSVTAEGDAK